MSRQLEQGSTAAIAARSPLELFWRRLREDKVAMTAAGFVVFLILAAIFAPLIIKIVGTTGPTDQNPTRSTRSGLRPAPARTIRLESTSSDATCSRGCSTARASRSRSP